MGAGHLWISLIGSILGRARIMIKRISAYDGQVTRHDHDINLRYKIRSWYTGMSFRDKYYDYRKIPVRKLEQCPAISDLRLISTMT